MKPPAPPKWVNGPLGEDGKETEYVFTFGKYKGKKVSEVPSSYLEWLIGEETIFPALRKKLVRELVSRASGVVTSTPLKGATALGSHPETSPDRPIPQTSRVVRVPEGGCTVTAPAWSVSRRQMRAQRIRNVVPSSMRPINSRRGFIPDAPVWSPDVGGSVGLSRRNWPVAMPTIKGRGVEHRRPLDPMVSGVSDVVATTRARHRRVGRWACNPPCSRASARDRPRSHAAPTGSPPGAASGRLPMQGKRIGGRAEGLGTRANPRTRTLRRRLRALSGCQPTRNAVPSWWGWCWWHARPVGLPGEVRWWPCRRAGHQSQPAHTYASTWRTWLRQGAGA